MDAALALDAKALRAVQEFDPAILRSIGGATLVIPCVVIGESITGWHLLIERYKRQ